MMASLWEGNSSIAVQEIPALFLSMTACRELM